MAEFTFPFEQEPTAEMVRLWGYDPRWDFENVDEDLDDPKLVPVLLELANDLGCPRHHLALQTLGYNSKSSVLFADYNHREAEAYAACAPAALNSENSDVRAWADYFLRLYARLMTRRALDDREALELAGDLIGGPYCGLKAERTGRTVSGFTEFCGFDEQGRQLGSTYKVFFYLHQQQGTWRFQQRCPFENISD